jgi:hypothetical protein
MKRDYADGVQDDVIYFTGYEVEKTPAEGEHTLFVTGCQPLEDVLAQAKEHTVEHIYLGANHSFVPKESWEDLVQGLLNKKFLVTLDYDVKYHEWILESGFNENHNFISMISVLRLMMQTLIILIRVYGYTIFIHYYNAISLRIGELMATIIRLTMLIKGSIINATRTLLRLYGA